MPQSIISMEVLEDISYWQDTQMDSVRQVLQSFANQNVESGNFYMDGESTFDFNNNDSSSLPFAENLINTDQPFDWNLL